MMYLHARTNRQGSEVSTPLDVSYKKWTEMTAKQQDDLVAEALGDLVESWVEDKYSQVLKRKSDLELLFKMDEAWASLGAKVVFCYRSSYDNIVDDLDSTIDSTVLRALDEKYREFFARSKCDHTHLNVDDEDLEREIREVVKFMNNVGEGH